MKNNEHACNRRFWNVATVSGTITVLPKERSNVSVTLSVTLCVTESVTETYEFVSTTTLDRHMQAVSEFTNFTNSTNVRNGIAFHTP